MKNNVLKNFKTIASYMLALLVIVSSFGFVSTTHATGPTLTIGSQTALNSAHIVVPIVGSNFTIGDDIRGVQFKVNYDNTLLSYTGYTGATIGTTTINNAGNYINILWDHSSALLLNNETFVSLNFNVISSSTVSANLNHSDELIVVGGSTPGTATFVDGVITLNPATLSSIVTVTSLSYTIGTNTITNVPFGTSKATFLAALTKGQVNQTWNDTGISDPVVNGDTLVITAQDGVTTVTYTVTVNAPSVTLSSLEITTLATKLSYTVSDVLDINGLVVTGHYSDNSTQIETITTSNVTGFDSSAPATDQVLTITVGGKIATYTVNVIAPLSSAKNITSFSFVEGNGTINEVNHTIAVTIPYGTSLTNLVASFITTGASVKIGTTTQTSGTTANDFTSPVTYTVTAIDSSTQDYIVTVTVVAPSNLSALTAAKSTAQGLIGAGAVESATPGNHIVGSLATLTTALSAANATEVSSQSVVDGQVSTLNSAISAYNLAIVPLSSMIAYDATLAAVNEADYTIVTWDAYQAIVDANVVANQNTQDEVDTATANITAAQGSLIAKAGLEAYTAALAVVHEVDYTTASWATYKVVVLANVVTDQDTQDAVTLATNNITAAQVNLVAIAVMTAYNATLSAVVEADYTLTSWATYQGVVTANIVTSQDLQSTVNTATANIVVAQDNLVTVAEAEAIATLNTTKVTAHTALTDALGTYTQENYTPDNWITLTGFKTDGDIAIDAAGTTGAVTSAQRIATDGMGRVHTIAQTVADDATTLATAKVTAHTALTDASAIYTVGNYTEANWTALNKFKTDGDIAIEAATTLEGVSSAQNTATAGMAGVATIPQHHSSGGSSSNYTKPVAPTLTEISGCDTRTTGFSTVTGQSCATNISHDEGKVLGVEKFNFTKFMKNGSKGNEIIELQKFLTTLGYTLTADGNFGPKTKGAVIKFQIANGLKGDGIIGALTRATLNK